VIRTWLKSPRAMVLAALALRLAVTGLSYTNRLDPARDHWTFGWETARVAQSIALGRGFSSPYPEPTGPTTLVPPAYTYLVAGVFELFGIYTPASAVVMLSLNDLFSSLTCLPVFFVARRVFGQLTAIRAGWLWAFFPYAVALANATVWETTLTTLLYGLVVLATLALEERPRSPGVWLAYGALWGITALSNPAVLSTFPFLVGWVWLRHRRRGTDSTGAALAAALVLLVVIAPWIWRCSRTYGRFVALRGSIGLEFMVGNSDDISEPYNFKTLPGNNARELERLKALGEPAYMAEKQREAAEVLARRPLRYVGLTLRRVVYTWTCFWSFPPRWGLDELGLPNVVIYSAVSLLGLVGLFRAIRDRVDKTALLVMPMIFLPAAYYLTHSEIRYRHPIDPILVVFMAYGTMAFRARPAAAPSAA
jgi:4-amino-4-deoxy-L-arabinose transferase-like glycosyltransferase